MTFAELGMAFWHDLAAPVIAGILAFFVLTAGKAPSRRRSGERTVYPGIE